MASRTGDRHPRWAGGRTIYDGYVMILQPSHPHADSRGYVPEHRLVAESVYRRILPRKAVVHHINEDGLDNRPSNLVICPDRAYHNRIHARMRQLKKQREAIGKGAINA